jgi:hypothetical protein
MQLSNFIYRLICSNVSGAQVGGNCGEAQASNQKSTGGYFAGKTGF